VDRVNVGFAKLQMAGDLDLSDEVYGFGAGIFFIGYFLFELPSNLIQVRVGARRWLARIMITWGAISAGFMFVGELRWGAVAPAFGLTDAEFSFYLMRFVLGFAEAGFVPGVLLYLTHWFPAVRRGHVIALFFIAIPLSNAISSPVSGAILEFLDGHGALRGWQWLFLLQGLPTVVFGLVILALLPDSPAEARWLDDDERALIATRLAEDEQRKAQFDQRFTVAEVFADWRVWALALADFSRGVIGNAINFWMPTLVQELGIDKGDYFTVGLVAMVPWGIGAAAMVLGAWNSDRTGDRLWHAVVSALLAGAGLLMLAFAGHSVALSLIALTLVASGSLAWLAVFWTLPTKFLSGLAAAGGIAWINSLAMLSGFVGPDLLGRVRGANAGDTSAAFLILAGFALLVAVLSWLLARQPTAVAREAAA
ncbi:MAG TPA: MFS transporter, partial [Croceibacterium sp.]|nr:MFS transporter [Croceibacterium sp.]